MKLFKKFLVFFIVYFFSIVFVNGQTYHKLIGNHLTWEQFQGDASTVCTLQSGQVIFEGHDTLIQNKLYKNY